MASRIEHARRAPSPAVARLTAVAAALAAAAALGAPTAADAALDRTASFTPASDTSASSARRARGAGRSARLSVDRRPLRRAYLRFRVRLPAGSVVKAASLRLFARSRAGSSGFYVVRLRGGGWSERRRLSLRRAPRFGARLGRARGWRRSGWKRVSLPASAVRRGTIRVGVGTRSRRMKSFGSRESKRRPRLVVRYSVPGSPGTASDVLAPPPGRALFGAWHKPSSSSSWSTGEYARWEGAIGRRVDLDHRFVAWNRNYWPGSNESWDRQNGRLTMLSIGGSSEYPGHDAVNSGSQDAWIASRADAIRALGYKVLLRPWWEMNGDWGMPWQGVANGGSSGGPAKYVAAWRRLVDIFRQRGATNALWVWAPNCNTQPDDAWNYFTNYYPGDGYVDWVGCDGYNDGSPWYPWSRDFGSSFDGRPSVYATYPHKPFMAAETASCEQGGDKGAWINQARADIKSRFPNLKAFVWFDENKECDWRAESSAGALAAFRAMGADPYFNP